nr:HNH endonuclease [Caudoviricetes sp.]
MTKICYNCKQEKDISEFSRKASSKDGYDSTCKICRTKRVKELQLNREKN